ncbi:hypothetical protein Pfo_001384 [Paulownia fortunei]|nr:hypothetical protein Pfo_001384 [Paulownia fortunei]
MGLIRSSLTLMLGMIGGAYIAQNYDVPNIRNLVGTSFLKGKPPEETHRKPKSNISTNHNK